MQTATRPCGGFKFHVQLGADLVYSLDCQLQSESLVSTCSNDSDRPSCRLSRDESIPAATTRTVLNTMSINTSSKMVIRMPVPHNRQPTRLAGLVTQLL